MGYAMLDKYKNKVYNWENSVNRGVSLEITGINSLWKDYEVTALPLNPYALSEKQIDGKKVREYYFDGYTTLDGKVRTYLKIYENEKSDGIVLFLPDTDGNEEPALKLYERGFTVAVLDYSGKNKDDSRYTIYPKSLEECNCIGATEFVAPDDTLNSRWFAWACMARRAVKLLKDKYAEKNIFAWGIGLGGSTVYKMCAFDDGLKAAATSLNVLPKVSGTGNPLINYRAALDNHSYAAATKVPLLMCVSTNDEDRSFDDMSELATLTASLKCLRICERSFKSGIKATYDQVSTYFHDSAKGNVDVPRPQVKATNSENSLYFNIVSNEKADNSGDGGKVELFAAYGIDDSRYRNWTGVPLISLGGGEYMARVSVIQDTRPTYAFVNLTDKNGVVSSSAMITVVPKSLNITASPMLKQKLIFDGNSGKDVWTSSDGGNISIKTGPYEIQGVSSDSKTLISFKLGDLLYTANNDSLLQIIACGEPQAVTIVLSDGKETYKTNVTITNSNDWHKFTLSNTDFKSVNGSILQNFSKAVFIKFTSEKEFIISSMLWV
ncbi:MAG: hypothetical protein J1F39_01825 [Clostridiales bacterium]|nr:hypothetical protein [Clostridiales bacterium]